MKKSMAILLWASRRACRLYPIRFGSVTHAPAPRLLALAAAAFLLPAGCAWKPSRPVDDGASRQSAYSVGDRDLERLQDLFRPTLEANRKEFQGRLGVVRGFGAGDRYPQVWLRDSATIVPLARWLHPRDHLTSWIEEHLAAQREDGALYDWLAAGGAAHFREWAPQARDVFTGPAGTLSADKNTTEADQEASAVLAAHRVWLATGDTGWLKAPVAGERLVDRLSRALRFVLSRRFDVSRGLVVNALTADWGDVSPVYPDQRAIYLDDATPLAVGLYTNGLVHAAALALAEMHERVGEPEEAAFFRERAEALREAAGRELWREEAGFYRMHVVTTPDRASGFPDDADVFAMGGHAVALLSGLVPEPRARRVFEVAEARRRVHGVSTVAGVLLPPYAEGAFRHPVMAQPWHYQNGGQWDWFAGRFVLAAFERGRSLRARAWLAEMARRAVAAGGLYEWYTRDGEGRGSPRYAGAAGALAQAVYEGLFGVDLRGSRLRLRIRLGELPAAVHLHQPATDDWVAYRYELRRRTITLRYQSSASEVGTLGVLLPPGAAVGEARLDGALVPTRREAVGEDTYAVVETDWRAHRLELWLE